MAEVLTTKLKNDTLRLFYDDLIDNEMYFAISSISTDELKTIDAVNSQFSKNQFKENIVFGKRAKTSDTKFMIKYYPWQKDAVYIQYDDQANLADKAFYAVVGPNNNDSGDYRIYKCLNNNNGGQSSVPPNYNAETERQIYNMPDGYVWKFMYYLTEQQFEAYNAAGFIPLEGTFEVNPDPEADANNVIQGSELSTIFVENYIDNNGYPSVDNGIIAGVPKNDSTMLLRNDFLSEINNYYAGMTLYVTIANSEESFSYEIDTYSWSAATDRGTVKVVGDPLNDGVTINSSFKIIPTIKIEGDGEGAKAIPNVVDGTIKTIEVIENGKNYNNITASVIDPTFNFNPDSENSIEVRATLRPILTPFGGHNWNLIDEMHCRHVLLYGYITETDNNQIGATNSYSAIGLLKNPEFGPDPANTQITDSPDVFDNRIQIVTNDYGKVEVNTLVKQLDVNNNKLFEGRVHEIVAGSNTVFLCSYMGPYINEANNDISLDTSLDLINETGQRLKINTPVANNVIESRYTQRSGTVYFMEDFVPLTRSKTSREEYKLVLEI